MKNSQRLSRLIRGSKIAAASLLAGAILSCSSNIPTVSPAKVAEEVVLEEVVAKEVHEPPHVIPAGRENVGRIRYIREEESYAVPAWPEEFGIPDQRYMTASTLEGELDYMTFVHDNEVNLDELTKLAIGTEIIHDYVKQLGMPEIDADIKAYIYSFPPELKKEAFVQSFCLDIYIHNSNTGEETYDSIRVSKIFLNEDFDKSHWISTFAHEVFHTYQELLRESQCTTNDPDILDYEPDWLKEGSAKLFEIRASFEVPKRYSHIFGPPDFQSYDEIRTNIAYLLKDSTLPLAALEENVEGDYAYNHAFLAAEYLASIAGESSMLRFYGSLRPDKPWRESFQKAFGMGIDEFYNRFDEHQANGFPKLDIPKGEPYVQPQN